MDIDNILKQHIQQALNALFQVSSEAIALQPTKKEFAGDYTYVTFPWVKVTKKRPEEIGELIGNYLKENSEVIANFNVVKGFLNLSIADKVWIQVFHEASQRDDFGQLAPQGQKVMVEFSSPNTNKPLHLGHLRNIFLGDSLSRILKANGYEVIKANLINDRGIHICKSMRAYQLYGEQSTPESSQIKGDHLVGKYYVAFDKQMKSQAKAFRQEIEAGNLENFSDKEKTIIQNTQGELEKLQGAFDKAHQATEQALQQLSSQSDLAEALQGFKNQAFKTKDLVKLLDKTDKPNADIKAALKTLKNLQKIESKISDKESVVKKIAEGKTAIMQDARNLLQKWEQNDPETVALWKQMNGWVYDGFDETYQKIRVQFDKTYYESNTYLLGKDIIKEGLDKELFFQKEDGSVWIDLTQDKLDQKILLRSDGTSVYMTQDLGTAELKYADYTLDRSVYVVGNEQDYHFRVLFKILEKMNRPYAQGLYHLSYAMVDLPSGKMKSREGTVVDADDLIQQMVQIAKTRTDELGKTEGFTEDELDSLYQTIALGALKYYVLKVDPQRRMLFNPEESLDFQGDAGPFIQYNYARISSILLRAQQENVNGSPENYETYTQLQASESALLQTILDFEAKLKEAGDNYNPSTLAQYAYEAARAYSRFFAECSIFQADSKAAMHFRVALSKMAALVIKKSMHLLGIDVPQRM